MGDLGQRRTCRSGQRRTSACGSQPGDQAEAEAVAVLAARGANGDPDAVARLVERFHPLVRAVVARAGIRGPEADDVIQETWARMVANLGSMREPAALAGWIRVTAQRLCLDLYRAHARCAPGLGEECPPLSAPSEAWSGDPCADVAIGRARLEALRAAIGGLDERDRRLVQLLLASAPYKEISDRLGMPMGSIGPTRDRVLRKLAASAPLRRFATSPASLAA